MRISRVLLGSLLLSLASRGGHADVNYTQGSGTVLFDFTCFTTKHCTAHVPINSSGTELFTASNPAQITGANGSFPITAASLPLPSGASSAAKQPALGTAGTASADVLTVQGIASMTAIKTDGSAVTQPVNGTVTANAGTNLNTSALALDASVSGLSLAQASTTSGQKGILHLGAVTTAAPSYTTAQTSPLNLTTSGGLRVDVATVAGAAAAQGQFVSLGPLGSGTAVDQNSGTKSAGSQRMVIATDDVAHAAWGQGATAAAPPAGAQYLGTSQSGLLAGVVTCDSYVTLHVTTATDTLVVQGVSAKTIKICGAKANFAGTATYKLQNTASTNANCSSTLTQIGPLISGVVNVDQGWYNPVWGGMKNTSANGLCVTSTGTGGFDLEVWYTQGS